MASVDEPLAIKRYGKSRLYSPGEARYVTLGELAAVAQGEEGFVVHDAQTGEDITRSVLQQIIEQERHG